MTRRSARGVARGRNEIDARLDLHGKTLAQAHGVLLRFLHRAQADGAAIVLVITGKGKAWAAEGERGALRREVPHWLGAAGIPHARPRLRGGAYRPRRRGRALRAGAAGRG